MVDTRGTDPSLDEAASSELPVPSVTDSAAHGEFSCAPFEGVSAPAGPGSFLGRLSSNQTPWGQSSAVMKTSCMPCLFPFTGLT
ncbi:phosphoinositide phosphatase [Aspergillus luchuensis]|uniref:Phosphoinositide phosphatase n=1 Tax=Aspergillus kawachii TaxID=1069201 RepID=A0A146F5I8_ASPKA|nr:phosphoinositide phosphatase [Aspergillus luchuensis]